MELTKIADWLLLNGTLTKCPGLLHGKLGIAIFFFHYARYTGKTLFEEYAWDLIMAIQEQLHVNYRPDYEKGIAGIGVGINYLSYNNLIEIEEDLFEDPYPWSIAAERAGDSSSPTGGNCALSPISKRRSLRP